MIQIVGDQLFFDKFFFMAAKKKKKKGQLTLGIGLNDERVPKLVGILLLFFALYLFIAFTSYLITWKEDQNRVLQFSWELLLQSDVEMANWLGRLGAIVSNMFFYWGFGVPSYIFVFLREINNLCHKSWANLIFQSDQKSFFSQKNHTAR